LVIGVVGVGEGGGGWGGGGVRGGWGGGWCGGGINIYPMIIFFNCLTLLMKMIF